MAAEGEGMAALAHSGLARESGAGPGLGGGAGGGREKGKGGVCGGR